MSKSMRLSKDGEWAVCASIPCGARLARRTTGPGLNEDYPYHLALYFLSGWVQTDAPGG